MVDAANLIVSILGGSAAGSAATLAAAARKDSRSARSEFLSPLTGVERARWEVTGDGAWLNFREACHRLESAAIVSGVSREAVETYLAYAHRCYRYVQREMERGNYDEEIGPGLAMPLYDSVMAMVAVVRDFAWTPRRASRAAPTTIRQINREFDKARPNEDWSNTLWPRHYTD